MKLLISNRSLNVIRSEKGAVSVLAIMVLLLLTIAGIASLYTARTEIQIAGNERDYVEALTYANAGLNETSQQLTNSGYNGTLLKPGDATVPWLRNGSRECFNCNDFCTDCTDSCATGVYDAEKLICASLNDDLSMVTSATAIDPAPTDTYHSALYLGNALGSSLDITQSKPLVEYTLYGLYNKSLGSNSSIRSLVESGYRNR